MAQKVCRKRAPARCILTCDCGHGAAERTVVECCSLFGPGRTATHLTTDDVLLPPGMDVSYATGHPFLCSQVQP